MVSKDSIIKILKTIPDPEIGISVWDLGLVYKIEITKKGEVEITITLTSVGCPLFDTIQAQITEQVGMIKGVTTVRVELTFEPPWTPDKMGEEAKMQLGFI